MADTNRIGSIIDNLDLGLDKVANATELTAPTASPAEHLQKADTNSVNYNTMLHDDEAMGYEKVPIPFLLEGLSRGEIETRILSAPTCRYGIGTRLPEVFEIERERLIENGEKSRLVATIDAMKGRLTPFEEAVKIATFYYVSRVKDYFGELPKSISIPMSAYEHLLQTTRYGAFYKRIREAIEKLDAMRLIHNFFVADKTDKEKFQSREKMTTAFVYMSNYEHTKVTTKKGITYERAYISFHLPPLIWHAINNGQTETMDVDLYMSLPTGRVRGLYAILERIRFDINKTVHAHDLYEKLTLNVYKEDRRRKAKLKDLFQVLVAWGYLAHFLFSPDNRTVRVTYKATKRKRRKSTGPSSPPFCNESLLDNERHLTARMVKEAEIDIAYARRVAEKLPEGCIIGALEDLEWRKDKGEITKNIGACFTHLLREKCNAYGVAFPFGSHPLKN